MPLKPYSSPIWPFSNFVFSKFCFSISPTSVRKEWKLLLIRYNTPTHLCITESPLSPTHLCITESPLSPTWLLLCNKVHDTLHTRAHVHGLKLGHEYGCEQGLRHKGAWGTLCTSHMRIFVNCIGSQIFLFNGPDKTLCIHGENELRRKSRPRVNYLAKMDAP